MKKLIFLTAIAFLTSISSFAYQYIETNPTGGPHQKTSPVVNLGSSSYAYILEAGGGFDSGTAAWSQIRVNHSTYIPATEETPSQQINEWTTYDQAADGSGNWDVSTGNISNYDGYYSQGYLLVGRVQPDTRALAQVSW